MVLQTFLDNGFKSNQHYRYFHVSLFDSIFDCWFVDDLIVDPRNLEWVREANCPVVSQFLIYITNGSPY
jgi:hypothetical protein